MSLRKKLITDSAVLFGCNIIAQVIGFIVIPIFITNLGANLYGLYAISGVLLGYVSLFDFGLTRGLTREIGYCNAAGDYRRMSTIVSAGLLVLFGVGFLTACFIYFGQSFLISLLNVPEENAETAREVLVVTAIFSFLIWPAKLPRSVLEGNLLLKGTGVIEAYKGIATALTLLLAVMLTHNLATIRVATCLALISVTIPYLWVIRRKIPDLKLRFVFSEMRQLGPVLVYGIKYFYHQLLALVSTKLDSFIIASMVSLGAVAAYQIVFKVQMVVTTVAMKLFGAFAPAVYRLDNDKDRGKLQTLLDEGLRYRAMIMAPLIAVLIVVSPAFITLWVGDEFRQYGIWAQLYLLVHFTTIFGFGATIIRASDKIGIANRIGTVRALLNLGLSLALVGQFGVGGPVLGTVISALLLGDLMCFPIYCRLTNLNWRQSFKVGLGAIGLMLPIIYVGLKLQASFPISSWWALLSYIAILGSLSLTILVAFFANKNDFKMAWSLATNLKQFTR